MLQHYLLVYYWRAYNRSVLSLLSIIDQILPFLSSLSLSHTSVFSLTVWLDVRHRTELCNTLHCTVPVITVTVEWYSRKLPYTPQTPHPPPFSHHASPSCTSCMAFFSNARSVFVCPPKEKPGKKNARRVSSQWTGPELRRQDRHHTSGWRFGNDKYTWTCNLIPALSVRSFIPLGDWIISVEFASGCVLFLHLFKSNVIVKRKSVLQ